MKDLFFFEIITPLGLIYQGEVKFVSVPGSEGEFGILKGHSALLSSLKSGLIDVEKADGKRELIAIDSGHIKVDENKVCVLAKGAICLSGSDESEIANNLSKAKDLIKSMSSDNAALAATLSKFDNARLN